MLSRKYWEVLSALLQNAVMTEMGDLTAYLRSTIDKLKIEPFTVREIAGCVQMRNSIVKSVPMVIEFRPFYNFIISCNYLIFEITIHDYNV